MQKQHNISGNKYGRLTAVGPAGKTKSRSIIWQCICDCGTITHVPISSLRSGHTKSCGCLGIDRRRDANIKHGQSNSEEYKIWASMIQRCTKNRPYGINGISVCQRWKGSFENFFADMGQRPSANHSIDRIDNTGNYEPANCRWADAKTQANNTKRNVWLTHNGVKKTVAQWSRELGIAYTTINNRLARGVAPGLALIKPQALREA